MLLEDDLGPIHVKFINCHLIHHFREHLVRILMKSGAICWVAIQKTITIWLNA